MQVYRSARLFMLFFAVMVFAGGAQLGFAQEGGGRYFSRTGHWVYNEFLTYYDSTPSAELLYGYPITEAFFDEDLERLVQFFQKARFEYYPERRPNERVQITSVGELLYQPGEPVDVGANNPACQRYSDSSFGDYQVCYDFLTFYQDYGGVERFGYPVSDMEFYGDRMMQYFEKSRIEWYPEYVAGSQITTGSLGSLFFQSLGLDASLLQPVPGNFALDVIDLRTRAFLDKATAGPGDVMALSVVVHDQNLQPLEGAQVKSYTITYPDGRSETRTMRSTDADGLTSGEFVVESGQKGITTVDVEVFSHGITEIVRTSFRIWW